MNYTEFYLKAITIGESSDTYKLYLESTDNKYAIVVIVGYFEAQLIAIAADKTQKTKRPLTHELFVNYMNQMSHKVEKIEIYKFETGTFFAKMIVKDLYSNSFEMSLDSRLSDAISMSMRFNAPIYIADHVVEAAAVSLEEIEEENIFEIESSEIKAPKESIEDVNLNDFGNELLSVDESVKDRLRKAESENNNSEFSNFSVEDLLHMRDDAVEANIEDLILKINHELLKRNINFE